MKLMFYKADKGNWLDKITNLFSGNYGYSHVEIAFEDDFTMQGKYVCFSSSPREGKVRFKYINPYANDHWEIVELGMSQEEEKELYDKCYQYVDAKYDYYGILFWYVFFWVKKQNDHEWWCSEIVSYLLGMDDYRKTPNELAKLYNVPKR